LDNSKINGPAPTKLILGIGNEFRSDDGVGPFLTRKLKELSLKNLEIREIQGEGTDLIEAWKGFDLVIAIDAVFSESKPGTIFRFEIPGEPIPKALLGSHSTHAFGLFEAIEMSRVLKTLPSRLIIFGIEGKNFEAGLVLSPEVESAATDVMGKITDMIARDL
jgi:hydrogenase maturation protease